jgi:hypothetical protein
VFCVAVAEFLKRHSRERTGSSTVRTSPVNLARKRLDHELSFAQRSIQMPA